MDREAADAADEMRVALQRVSVHLEAIESSNDAIPVCLVVFSCVTPSLLSWIREHSQSGRLLLALAHPGDAGLAQHSWRLMDAGVSDVFAWGHSAHPELDIRSRIVRFAQIEALMASSAVTEFMVGRSPVWTQCIRQIVEIAAFSQASVMITGESGTGKELVARLIHRLDSRVNKKREPVVLDCTTVVPELSGSEFFGHERGAFTGANQVREGALAIANGGSLFLDEVGELPLKLQAELLRAVQERSFKKVGSNVWETSEYRLICATHRDLVEDQQQGKFRLDFYHRIASWRCRLPALDERRSDIMALVQHFALQQRPDWAARFDEPVEQFLVRRPYPGNVRDLKQLVGRLMHRHVGDGPVTVGDLPAEERCLAQGLIDASGDTLFDASVEKALAFGIGLKDIGRMAEDAAVRLALHSAQGNLQVAAQRLAVSDRALQMRKAQKAQRGIAE
jgi:transcriptional regulator with GAF, ATPase, and Fis domain